MREYLSGEGACAIEPRAVAVQPKPNKEGFAVGSSTQVPHFVKDMLALMGGVPDNSPRFVALDAGGGFGSKLNVYAEEAQALYEGVIYDESGNPVTGSKASYIVLGTPKSPTSSSTRRRAFYDQFDGSDGHRESGATGSSASVVNPAIDALSHEGVTHVDMSATPWKTWHAIHATRKTSAQVWSLRATRLEPWARAQTGCRNAANDARLLVRSERRPPKKGRKRTWRVRS